MNTDSCDTCGAVMLTFPGAPFASMTRKQCTSCANAEREMLRELSGILRVSAAAAGGR
jgi:hypothetical protein